MSTNSMDVNNQGQFKLHIVDRMIQWPSIWHKSNLDIDKAFMHE